MSKGTPSRGKRSGNKSHIICRRCGKHTYNVQKRKCASCGYGATAKIRVYTWKKLRDN
jgi:large subunit ribosomal protein L37e